MDWKDYIVSDQKILAGKPAIKGTRISVEHIVGLVGQKLKFLKIFLD